MSNNTPLPVCQVGDIIRYDWEPDENIFLVFGIKKMRGINIFHYSCFSLYTSEIYKFEFVHGPPEVLA